MPDRDPAASPEQDARLRELLADARHGDPIPVDVAARLELVLEQLASEGPAAAATAGRGGGVDELAARRRRRVTGLLVAAAAVVVVGVGIGQVTRTDGSQDDSASSASSPEAADGLDAAGTGGAATDNSQKTGPRTPSPEASMSAMGPPPPGNAQTAAAPVRLTKEGFARQVLRYRDVPGFRATVDGNVSSSQLSQSDAFLCAPADFGAGKLVASVYDDLPAVLAYRAPAGTTQTVDLLRCGTGEVLRSTVLAQP